MTTMAVASCPSSTSTTTNLFFFCFNSCWSSLSEEDGDGHDDRGDNEWKRGDNNMHSLDHSSSLMS
ncbi:hypothetical protein TYRP_002578 [Tyrophagus putrescentiae]|nr:hypothetical protein TYRP_002578 [Tyrophagus putrescentiae]